MHEAGKTGWRLNRSAGFSHLYGGVEKWSSHHPHKVEIVGSNPASRYHLSLRLDPGNLSEALCFRRLAVSGGLRNNLRSCVVNAGAPRIVKSKGHYTSEQPS